MRILREDKPECGAGSAVNFRVGIAVGAVGAGSYVANELVVRVRYPEHRGRKYFGLIRNIAGQERIGWSGRARQEHEIVVELVETLAAVFEEDGMAHRVENHIAFYQELIGPVYGNTAIERVVNTRVLDVLPITLPLHEVPVDRVAAHAGKADALLRFLAHAGELDI